MKRIIRSILLATVVCFAFLEQAQGMFPSTVDSYVTFGQYPQTSEGTDQTPIEWKVLARDGEKALLISRYALDCKPYNKNNVNVTWEASTLRQWLNDEFLNKAFTPVEQAAIEITMTDNSRQQGNPEWGSDGGNNTQEKVFLLSYQEASKYFADGKARRCAPTDYTIKNGAYTNDGYKTNGISACWWWLRSPGSSNFDVAGVNLVGDLSYISGVDCGEITVRPALWVNLASGIF